jgi:hypothetical protein
MESPINIYYSKNVSDSEVKEEIVTVPFVNSGLCIFNIM